MNSPEILSFQTKDGRYLARQLIQSRKHLILFIQNLVNRHEIEPTEIIFNHDLDDSEYKGEMRDNFKLKESYDFLSEMRAKSIITKKAQQKGRKIYIVKSHSNRERNENEDGTKNDERTN